MTALITNSTFDTCAICSMDSTDSAKTESKKVTELACKHFFHMSCLASWFDNKKENFKNLTCDNCSQLATVSNESIEREVTSNIASSYLR